MIVNADMKMKKAVAVCSCLEDVSGVYDAHLLSEQALHCSLTAKSFTFQFPEIFKEDLQVLWSFKAFHELRDVLSRRSLMGRRRGW